MREEEARLQWLCRRGMKELDLLLKNYLQNYYLATSASEQESFKSLLNMPDPELYDLILGRTQADDNNMLKVIDTLRQSLSI